MSVDDPQSATENAYTFVLVHGGCHDGSLWQPVIERLEQLGHTAYGPTVAGHGKDVPKNVTHAESTQSIVDFIVDQGPNRLRSGGPRLCRHHHQQGGGDYPGTRSPPGLLECLRPQ